MRIDKAYWYEHGDAAAQEDERNGDLPDVVDDDVEEDVLAFFDEDLDVVEAEHGPEVRADVEAHIIAGYADRVKEGSRV